MREVAKVIHMDSVNKTPQLEDGYVRIANELMDAMLLKLSSYRHLSVALAIVRKTYGYNKKEDDITISQLAEATGIHRNHVGSAVKDLEKLGVINQVRAGQYGLILGINKRHSEWEFDIVKPRGSTKLVASGDNQNSCIEQPKQLQRATKTVETGNQNVAHKRQPQKTTPKDNSKRHVRAADAAVPDMENEQPQGDCEPDGFSACWMAYPKRAGGNPKASALRAYAARLKDGVSPIQMLDGTKRYAAYVKATGADGSQYVKQAATFYGRDQHFLEEWSAPSKSPSRHSGFEHIDYREGVEDDGRF